MRGLARTGLLIVTVTLAVTAFVVEWELQVPSVWGPPGIRRSVFG